MRRRPFPRPSRRPFRRPSRSPAATLVAGLCLLLPAAPAAAQETAQEADPGRLTSSSKEGKVVEPGDWVWIDFAMWEESGAIIDTTTYTEPLRLRQGEGRVPPEVDRALLGMAVDDHKTVKIPMKAAEVLEDSWRFENVALDSIPETTREVGRPIAKRAPSGEMRAGVVREIKGDRAVIDWYPLAGQTLTFDFRVVEIHVPAE